VGVITTTSLALSTQSVIAAFYTSVKQHCKLWENEIIQQADLSSVEQ